MSRQAIFYFSNTFIIVGYYALAFNLAKLLLRFMRGNWKIKVGAGTFFITCSISHLLMIIHVRDGIVHDHAVNAADLMLSTPSLINHGMQAVGVFLFILGVLQSLSQGHLIDRQQAFALYEELTKKGQNGDEDFH